MCNEFGDGEGEAAGGVCNAAEDEAEAPRCVRTEPEESQERDPDLEEEVSLAESGLLDDDLPELSPRFRRHVTVSLHAPLALRKLFHAAVAAVRSRHGWHHDEGECLHWMLLHFAHTHASPEIERILQSYVIAERDAWLCSLPHCRSHGPFHRHHKILRSRGGPDDPWNLFLLCDACHRLVHDGKVVIRGRAPDDLFFFLGVRPDGSAREVYNRDLRVPRLEVPEPPDEGPGS